MELQLKITTYVSDPIQLFIRMTVKTNGGNCFRKQGEPGREAKHKSKGNKDQEEKKQMEG
jgi:hypothetical protein